MDIDIDDLLGEEPSRAKKLEDKLAQKIEEGRLASSASYQGVVNLDFLVKVFGGNSSTVARRLANCPVAQWVTHKGKPQPRYRFVEAVQYLVKPKVDLTEWLQNAKDFPPELQKAFWSAMREKQRWQIEAGELWRTEDVMAVFGSAFLEIKETTRLWVERLPQSQEMTTAQYEAFQNQVTALVDEMHHRLLEMPERGRTLNLRDRFEEGSDDSDVEIPEDAPPDDEPPKRKPGRPRKAS